MKTSTPFCIAGMHRSGTSLIAGWMYSSGIFFGHSLLKAASSNPKGHFEDEEFLEFHSKILEREGFHRSGLTIEHNNFEFNSNEYEIAKAIIQDRMNMELWSWKEPRTTLFLDSYKQLIPNLKIIGIYRKPELVIDSLYKRLKKNKWYYTRNPIKKLEWYLDIDLKKSKWVKTFSKTYALYNEKLLNIKNDAPDEVLLFDIDVLISNPEIFEKKVNELLALDLNLIPFEDFYEEKYISKKTDNINFIPDENAQLSYSELQKLSDLKV